MQIIILQLFLFIFLFPVLVWSADKIQGSLNTDVQLQENGYIKIIGQPTEVRSYHRTGNMKSFDLPESDNELSDAALMKKYNFKAEDMIRFRRSLIVHFQFLKPCTSTDTELPPSAFIGDDDFKALRNWNILEIPRFRCDYRFKVFVTFFLDGTELETIGEYPGAYWTDLRRVERKREMLPGEKSHLIFSIPAAEDHSFMDQLSETITGKKLPPRPPRPPRVISWKAWVPK